MRSEDAKKMKCDQCGVVVGLYQHDTGYRCPECIWKEKERLDKEVTRLLNMINELTKL